MPIIRNVNRYNRRNKYNRNANKYVHILTVASQS